MDWLLAGILTGIVVATGAAAYGVVSVTQSDAPPPKKVVKVDSALVPKAALPVFVTPSEPREEFASTASTTSMANLASPPPPFAFDEAAPRPAPPPVRVAKPPPIVAKPPPDAKVASLPPPGSGAGAPAAVQWRVVATANASYFNLGGHIDGAGTVDSLASSHLRDAFKAHRNFSKLPPDVRNHILTQNISLTKIAPYRGLLGIDDRKIEQEQAVRFERVGGPRAPG